MYPLIQRILVQFAGTTHRPEGTIRPLRHRLADTGFLRYAHPRAESGATSNAHCAAIAVFAAVSLGAHSACGLHESIRFEGLPGLQLYS